ncbi:uncharacterized protein LOC143293573 isoform X6 [Babylonia areolata]|uniref:uncharacterized protein LOC143293573 isoform X6 n=1 Tax=Babylonia areolata TaxID=304850 RepID=UPI003FD14E20
MDEDSSTKFIGSLTKFLQSLCNGYVEFQRGVELVGHIYLSIDTGEKVDYILHEKVSKNDENSVTFVSNSFHAQPTDKKTVSDKDKTCKSNTRNSKDSDDDDDDDDDNDIMIVDQTEVPGSTNSGTIPRGGKHVGSSGPGRGSVSHQGSINPVSSPQRNRQLLGGPSATVTSQDVPQDNINMGNVKLEQLSTDELLSLASHVEGGSSHNSPMMGQHGGPARVKRSSSLGDTAGQPVWIKQEMPDDVQGGPDTGWPHGRDGQSDTSNSGSDPYPVMMHQSPAYSSSSAFPAFTSVSGQSSSGSRHHGLSQHLPGMSGAANLYANPLPGTSQSMAGMDPADYGYSNTRPVMRGSQLTTEGRLYREKLKRFNPEGYALFLMRQKEACRRYRERRKMLKMAMTASAAGQKPEGPCGNLPQ